VLLRFVDDYLFITTDVTAARKFLSIMHQGTRSAFTPVRWSLYAVIRASGVWVHHR
jgi:hypothetical protein